MLTLIFWLDVALTLKATKKNNDDISKLTVIFNTC